MLLVTAAPVKPSQGAACVGLERSPPCLLKQRCVKVNGVKNGSFDILFLIFFLLSIYVFFLCVFFRVLLCFPDTMLVVCVCFMNIISFSYLLFTLHLSILLPANCFPENSV